MKVVHRGVHIKNGFLFLRQDCYPNCTVVCFPVSSAWTDASSRKESLVSVVSQSLSDPDQSMGRRGGSTRLRSDRDVRLDRYRFKKVVLVSGEDGASISQCIKVTIRFMLWNVKFIVIGDDGAFIFQCIKVTIRFMLWNVKFVLVIGDDGASISQCIKVTIRFMLWNVKFIVIGDDGAFIFQCIKVTIRFMLWNVKFIVIGDDGAFICQCIKVTIRFVLWNVGIPICKKYAITTRPNSDLLY